VGVLDVRGAIVATAEGKQAQAELQSQFAPRQAELENIKKQIDDIQKRLEAGQRTLSDDEKARLARQADLLSRRGQRLQEELREELQAAEGEVIDRIGRKMREVLDRYARENGFTIIFDVSSQAGIVYATNTIDITQDIVRLYDQAHPIRGAAPAQPRPQTQPGTPAQKPPAQKPPQQ
jgi:outer membrane protein